MRPELVKRSSSTARSRGGSTSLPVLRHEAYSGLHNPLELSSHSWAHKKSPEHEVQGLLHLAIN